MGTKYCFTGCHGISELEESGTVYERVYPPFLGVDYVALENTDDRENVVVLLKEVFRRLKETDVLEASTDD